MSMSAGILLEHEHELACAWYHGRRRGDSIRGYAMRVLLFVGKGGVGKTSVAAATSLLAARRDKECVGMDEFEDSLEFVGVKHIGNGTADRFLNHFLCWVNENCTSL